jgi:hypothetical protein
VTEVTDSSLTAATGVTLAFTLRRRRCTNVNLSATGGGQILFPVATSYTGNNYADTTIEASGAGSRIDLSHLTTWYGGGEYDGGVYGGGWHYYTDYVRALAGGEVDLAGCDQPPQQFHGGR